MFLINNLIHLLKHKKSDYYNRAANNDDSHIYRNYEDNNKSFILVISIFDKKDKFKI